MGGTVLIGRGLLHVSVLTVGAVLVYVSRTLR